MPQAPMEQNDNKIVPVAYDYTLNTFWEYRIRNRLAFE